MRHRKVKNLEPRIAACSHYLVEDAKSNKGRWREFFDAAPDSRLYLELGCGKGKFLCGHAAADTDAHFIGIEGLDAVMVRGLERATEENIGNIRFVMDFVADIRDYFADGELDGIYLNFSDPWPKPRHEKRRFTYGPTLLKYQQILKGEGFVAFKTDNEDLFDYSISEINRLGLNIEELSRDLHSSNYGAKAFTTEYEDKFHGRGKNINYVKLSYPKETLPYEIRLAEEKDMGQIGQLYVKNWRTTYKGLLPQSYLDHLDAGEKTAHWTAYCKEPKQGIFVACQEDEVLGFAAYKPYHRVEDCIYMDSVHVAEAFRGRGIGTALIRKVLEQGRMEEYGQAGVCIVKGNDDARRLYVKLGAAHLREKEDDYTGEKTYSEILLWPRP